MTYYLVESFAAGMDVRKSAHTAPAGTLRMLKNAVVNQGGEIHKRWAFVYFADAPAGSFGLLRKGDFLYSLTVGGVSVPPTTTGSPPIATSVGTIALAGIPGGVFIVELMDYSQFANKLYTIVRGSDGGIYHHLDGVLSAMTGTACLTYQNKIYTVDGGMLKWSTSGDPLTWPPANYIDLSAVDTEMLDCRALEVYYNNIVVFSQRAAQLWSIDPDPSRNNLSQTLRQAGISAPRSARQYGSGDVLYLSQDGIRSLKSREQTLTASVSDIGSPIDPYIQELYQADVNAMTRAIALLEPANGRYWFVLKDKILVLSNYPSPKISAWSVFVPPFEIVDAAVAGPFVYVRDSTDKVWRYGSGLATPVYDTAQAEVILPFLAFDKPATGKQLKALDVSCHGTWDVSVGLNPGDEAAEDLIGAINGPTFLQGQIAVMGQSTHISLRFRTTAATMCLLSNLMIHYEETDTR